MAHLLDLLDNIKNKINNINIKLDTKKIKKLSQNNDDQSKVMDVILDHGSKTKDENNIHNTTKGSKKNDKPTETTKITLQPANISEEQKSKENKDDVSKDPENQDTVNKDSSEKEKISNIEQKKPEVKLPEPAIELAEDDGFSGGSLKIKNKNHKKIIKKALQKIDKNKKGVNFKRKIPIYNSKYQYGGGNTNLKLDKILLKNNNLYAKLNNGKLFRINKFEYIF